ncbi:MerR family transcriptional regulator [Streptomyces sp. NPDC017993]|uniref:helix-turn-helix domain-containing protein n=1 Tax=Streptomyces sp. NPDC017993 TaxID=3365027 RepID=UPI0037A9918B
MSDAHPQLLTIGQLARRTGLAVRTIRYWSDVGALPPAGRSEGGYRLYDAGCVARLELVRTLRELGIGLGDVHRVLSGDSTVAEVAATHVAALDARIRALKVSRAVLSTVAKRGSTAEETALMNKLARLSAAERRQIIDDFTAEVFDGLGVASRISERMRRNPIELPDDPTPEQVDAWIELAELVQDPDFRSRMRTLMTLTTAGPGEKPPPSASVWFAGHAVQVVGAARSRGVDPVGRDAAAVLADLFGDADRADVLRGLRAGMLAEAQRYRRLVAIVRGREPQPAYTEELHWLERALQTEVQQAL